MARSVLAAGLAGLLLIGLTGCFSHRIISSQSYLIEAEALPVLPIPHALALSGGSPASAAPWPLCTRGLHRYYAHPDDLTQGALQVAADILIRNGAVLDDQAEKRLILSVIETACEIGFWTIDLTVRIHVLTGQGYANEFVARESIGDVAGTQWAVDQALAEAVAAIFEDRHILEYLGPLQQ